MARRTLRLYKSYTPVESLEGLTVVRYDEVNTDSDVSIVSMSINNGPTRNSYQFIPTPPLFRYALAGKRS